MNKERFIEEAKELNIILDKEELDKFETYKNLLKEYNKKFNLTSITDDENIYLKHFYDSLCLFKVPELINASTLLDIGTGAGFPGIPIAICKKNIKVTLVEANGKKCNFLNLVKEKLNLNNVEVINRRAEDYTKTHKNEYDIVTSRAVAHLNVLSELEIPSLKINGYFLPLKSNIDNEIIESSNKIEKLGGIIEEKIAFKLPIENSNRSIIKIKKIKETPEIYPREYSKIIKEIK